MFPKVAALALLCAPIGFSTAVSALELEYVSHIPLYFPEIDLTEPSGLAVDPEGSGFWIVSDTTHTVFRLDANGDIAAYIGRDDRMRDLEGVAHDVAQRRLLMVSERTGSIVAVSLDPPHRTAVVDIAALPSPADLSDALEDRQNGLEGIAVNAETGTVLVLKERSPRLLVEMTPSLDRVISVRALNDILPDGEDVSGLAVDSKRRGIWILSDVGKSVYFLPDHDAAIDTIDLFWMDGTKKRALKNAEGAALSPDGRSLFVVTDDEWKSVLVHYAIVDSETSGDE